MAYKYCVRKKIDKSSDEEKVRYYAVPVISGKINLRGMAKKISQRCTLTEGDVMATIIELAHIIEDELCNGNKVIIDDIGSLYLSATSPGFNTPEDCKPRYVKANRICFKSSTKLRKKLPEIKFKKVSE